MSPIWEATAIVQLFETKIWRLLPHIAGIMFWVYRVAHITSLALKKINTVVLVKNIVEYSK